MRRSNPMWNDHCEHCAERDVLIGNLQQLVEDMREKLESFCLAAENAWTIAGEISDTRGRHETKF